MKKGLTGIIYILDQSSSMGIVRDAAVSGFNEFLRAQKALPGEAIFWLTKFSTIVEPTTSSELKLVPELGTEANPYIPNGWTALHDAVGRTIVEVGSQLARLPESERPERVVCVIHTDGEENHSKEYTTDKVKGLIEEQKNHWKWEFLFVGADQDAWTAADQYGIAKNKTLSYDNTQRGTGVAFAATSDFVRDYRNAPSGFEVAVEDNDLREQKP